MSSDSAVLVIDDGELESVRQLLDELGAEATHVRSDQANAAASVSRLLITTARIAHSLRLERTATPLPGRATWIAFVTGDSKTQRALLQKAGFDFLIREPVHPAALRVLLQRALFRGNDTRRAPRVAFGCHVKYRTGLWRRSATLVDLSPRGCRLLMSAPLKTKTAIHIQIPADLAGGKSLSLSGHVVRVSPADREGGVAAEHSVGVRFGELGDSAKSRLRAVLAERVIGPAALPAPLPVTPATAKPAPTAKDKPGAAAAKSEPPKRKRRVNRRAKYRRQVRALEGADSYMILCLDISVGGMRVEPIEGLGVGSKLNLAIQLASPEEPLMVEATVVRDDGENGLALRFDWLAPESVRRIQRLLMTLPAIEGLHDEARRQGTILATPLTRSPRPKSSKP
jgi:hypothetical protein